MNDHRRYQPYYRVKNNYKDRRYEDDDSNDLKRHYKKSNPYHQSSSSSSRRDDRLNYRNYKDFSHRRSYRDDYRYNKHSQMKPKSYSTFSTPPPSLISMTIPPPLPLVPPPPPPPPPQTVVPHERESWIRSVKKTKVNESTEQKTQYLETMLRMPQQQKSTINSSKFDRMRFADERSLSTSGTNSTTNATIPTEDLINGSLHLVGDVHENGDIRTVEEILFNNDLNKTNEPTIESQSSPTPIASGFLIDDCEDEEELPPPPAPVTLIPSVTPEEPISDPLNDIANDESRVLLLHELDDADAERRKEFKRQKRLQRKLKLKKLVTTAEQPTSTTTNFSERHESSSDWVVEYDVEPNELLSKLTDEIRQTTNAMNDVERTEKMNLILSKIKKQQDELKKLRQYVLSVLGDEPQRNSTSKTRSTSNITQDLLLALLNQSNSNSCWLCSGKFYSEIGTQCDELS